MLRIFVKEFSRKLKGKTGPAVNKEAITSVSLGVKKGLDHSLENLQSV